MKVVWLCHFTNYEVQEILKPIKKVNEIAPWISSLIRLFENRDDIDLHIVSQHDWLPGDKNFVKNGITYHFINKGMPFIGRHWPGFFRFDRWTDFYHFKKRVAKIINKINPDIIHLHGAENEFCTAITQFKGKYPVFITIQGFIHHSSYGQGKSFQERCQKEIEIIKTFENFGYRTETMGKDILKVNPKARLYWHYYPFKKIAPTDVGKKFDIVFFARLSKDKGIEDLLKAISIIRKGKPDISVCVIGGGKKDNLVELSSTLGISENVFWAGFLPTQEDVHRLVSTAKIGVLPTYHDIIPGTIIESLFLKIPVVAYDVGSIHEVNQKEEIISLVEKGDIEGLAKGILTLLNDEELCQQKAVIGYKRAMEMFFHSAEEIRASIIRAYKDVMSKFKGEGENSHRIEN